MAKKIKYNFGGQDFSSKDAVRRFGGGIRARYRKSATISALADVQFLQDILQGHVERTTKIGVGVNRFFVDAAPDHPGECFWLERVDGSKTDFGVPACLEAIGRINRMALRMAIRHDLDTFKADALVNCGDTFTSQFSGNVFPVSEAVADHVIPFEQIILNFFGARGVDVESRMLTRSIDQSDPEWIDKELLNEFLLFHRAHPLRLVQWRENLSEIKATVRWRKGER